MPIRCPREVGVPGSRNSETSASRLATSLPVKVRCSIPACSSTQPAIEVCVGDAQGIHEAQCGMDLPGNVKIQESPHGAGFQGVFSVMWVHVKTCIWWSRGELTYWPPKALFRWFQRIFDANSGLVILHKVALNIM